MTDNTEPAVTLAMQALDKTTTDLKAESPPVKVYLCDLADAIALIMHDVEAAVENLLIIKESLEI